MLNRKQVTTVGTAASAPASPPTTSRVAMPGTAASRASTPWPPASTTTTSPSCRPPKTTLTQQRHPLKDALSISYQTEIATCKTTMRTAVSRIHRVYSDRGATPIFTTAVKPLGRVTMPVAQTFDFTIYVCAALATE